MKNDIAQALLNKVIGISDSDPDTMIKNRKYFQTMARYKYDDYHQYYPGMRFLEKFALWLEQFKPEDRTVALDFIENKLVFISHAEMNLLVSSAYPDLIKDILVGKIATESNIPYWKVGLITASNAFKALKRKSLFCGLSDGARTEVFRRSNPRIISHEQVYLTYELSPERAKEMSKKLTEDLTDILGAEPEANDAKFKTLFLLDDFSASGTSYLKYKESKDEFKGKIAQLYKNLYGQKEIFSTVFDLDNLEVYLIMYFCTQQALEQIQTALDNEKWPYPRNLKLKPIYLIPDTFKLTPGVDDKYIDLCKKEEYYDKDSIEDDHTGADIHLGYGGCSLPLVLGHNTPNNTVPLLWAYDNGKKFKGLFPRIPRHKEI
jgi:hypothetical protein